MSTIVLPSANGQSTGATGKFSEPVRRPVEPVGRYFLAHAARSIRGHTWSEYEQLEAAKNAKLVDESEDNGLDLDDEQPEDLLTHDPREWKTADLYATLGLSKYRHKATTEDIRVAYRDAVLKHHPDKKAEKGGIDQDGFFKIVQKAYETLMDPIQRRRFDSVDKNADVEPPVIKSEYDFFEAWGPVFASESRFSKKQPVPQLGDKETAKADVEAFYNFWYKFDSWRTFEFLDEEAPDDSSNRDHKRYIERKNKAARDKKKTDDNKRLLKLVDRAIGEDPRIKMFKQLEKEAKAKRKWDREADSRKAAEEAKAKAEAEAKAKAEAEAKAKADKDGKKKSKEAAKNAKKKNKRAIRGSAKDAGYFGDEGKAAAIDAEIDLLLGSFDDVTLADVAGAITSDAKAALTKAAQELISAGKLPAASIKYFV
ncbi:zuotin [Saccharomycopsis crataegensis]|uniref:Zuotin n=1 Tax=Saccharomycopsis crataegensis TaxID=43959 RepID=A0AAV5QG43_9ASCO|nr:zuotin [Saccharomycopsis crataegensis]